MKIEEGRGERGKGGGVGRGERGERGEKGRGGGAWSKRGGQGVCVFECECKGGTTCMSKKK